MYRPTLFSNPADHADRTIPAQAETARTTTPRVFAARCAFRPDGKLVRKEEREGPHRTLFDYEYDADGRLTQVSRDGTIAERYLYNPKGQRTAALYPALGRACEFAYDAHGRLLRAGDVTYAWSPKGALTRREIGGFRTLYRYGDDTRLDALILPNHRRIRYEYGDGLMPVRILCDDQPAVEYLWEDPLRLRACRDLRSGDAWSFAYSGGRIPREAILEGPIARAYGADRLHLAVHADQVGSIRLLTLPDSRVLKRLEYDSFGNILDDSPEELCFPFGFAGGLRDPFSGLTRFGFRDYDPEAGRFTAKDPLGDTGGDHDLYDYCVDDPVSMNDPSGLKGEPADERQYGWFRRNLFGWTTQKGSEELVAAVRKAMGAGKPDAGKDDATEGGQYSRLRPWWTYPKTDPVYLKKHEEFLAAMAKEMGSRQHVNERVIDKTFSDKVSAFMTPNEDERKALEKSLNAWANGMMVHGYTFEKNPIFNAATLLMPEISLAGQARKEFVEQQAPRKGKISPKRTK